MEGMKKFKENEAQRNKLSETLQAATTKSYTARKWGGIIRMQAKIEMESFISATATASWIEMLLRTCVHEMENGRTSKKE